MGSESLKSQTRSVLRTENYRIRSKKNLCSEPKLFIFGPRLQLHLYLYCIYCHLKPEWRIQNVLMRIRIPLFKMTWILQSWIPIKNLFRRGEETNFLPNPVTIWEEGIAQAMLDMEFKRSHENSFHTETLWRFARNRYQGCVESKHKSNIFKNKKKLKV